MGRKMTLRLNAFKFGVNLRNRWQAGVLAEISSGKRDFEINYRSLGVFIKKLM